MGAGIDYGNGKTNTDPQTGIRYGVISQNSVMSDALDDLEPDYGDPHCPKCGDPAEAMPEGDDPVGEDWTDDGSDYICRSCKYAFESYDAFTDESSGFTYDQDGYSLTDCLDTDLFILKSPYYTFARFCSPCVPGAGNLDNPDPEGAKTYCLGHDWFEGEKAPYPVYSVETGEEVNE